MRSIKSLETELRHRKAAAMRMKKRHINLYEQHIVCSAHHFGCLEPKPHYHNDEHDVVLTRV